MTQNEQALFNAISETADFPIAGYTVDRVLALLGDEPVEYIDSGLRRSGYGQPPLGVLVVFTATRVLRQEVTETGEEGTLHLHVEVARRNGLISAGTTERVSYDARYATGQTEFPLPRRAQLHFRYAGLTNPVVLPAIPEHGLAGRVLREYLPALLADLDETPAPQP